MGQCLSTPPRVNNVRGRPQRPIQHPGGNDFANMGQPIVRKHDRNTEREYYNRILNGIHNIANPSNLVPQVCVGDDSFPLVTSVIKLEEPGLNDISLPIISISLKGNGRIACISSLDFLLQQNFLSFDTALFFKQLARLFTASQKAFAQAYCLGFTRQEIKNFKQTFENMGLFIETGNFPESLSSISIIIMKSSFNLSEYQSDQLYKFVVEDGNSILMFDNPNEDADPLINDFLMRFGIRFTNLISSDDSDSIEIKMSFDEARQLTFADLSRIYIQLISKDNIEQSQLDDIVTKLRIYVLACGDDNTSRLNELVEKSWDYLKRTGYLKDGVFFHSIQQSIVAVLMLDLMQKMPLDMLKPIEGYEIFPGKTGDDIQLSEFDVDMVINSQELTSTGLWLPAGVIGELTIENPPLGAFIQIGCHNEKNFVQTVPLKAGRWPSTIVTEAIISSEMKIGTPFGGCVYLTIGEEEESFDEEGNEIIEVKNYNIHVKFSNFCLYPRYLSTDPSTWEQTKDFDVPWGEIETSNIIFTMPSENMRTIDIAPFAQIIEKLVDHIKEFVGANWEYKFRVVFDVVIDNSSSIISYPIVFTTDQIDPLVEGTKTPNKTILDLLTGIATYLLETANLDDTTKLALATVGAAAALSKEFTDFAPASLQDVQQFPELFQEIWVVYKTDQELIPKVLKMMSDDTQRMSDVPEDQWITFVRNISTVAGHDFSQLFIRTRPIPLSVINSLKTLTPFTFN